MKNRTVIRMALSGTLAAALTLVGVQPALAQAKDKVTLMLNWYVYSEHAPFFLGKEKGFFAQEGIDLNIQEGKGSGPTIQAVANDSVDFGYVDIPTMVKIAAKGAPVKAVGVLLQVTPMALMSYTDSNIRSPKDLVGKTVALTPGDSPSQIWPLFLKKAGIDEKSFKVVSGNAQTKLNAVINGQAQALPGYVMDQGIRMQEVTKKPVTSIRFADYGITLVSSGIVASNNLMAKKPDLVKRFMKAATLSAEAAEKDPEAAVAALLKAYPDAGTPPLLLLGVKQTTELFHTADTKNLRPYRVAPDAIEKSLDVLVQYGGLEKALRGKFSDYVTLDYLP